MYLSGNALAGLQNPLLHVWPEVADEALQKL